MWHEQSAKTMEAVSSASLEVPFFTVEGSRLFLPRQYTLVVLVAVIVVVSGCVRGVATPSKKYWLAPRSSEPP
jgi:hypothetical protein